MDKAPKFLKQFNGLYITSKLNQEMEISIDEDTTAYIEYKNIVKGSLDEKTLRIDVPDFVLPDDRSGLYCEVLDYSKGRITTIKKAKDYEHSDEAEKIFYDKISPVLEDKIPKYMAELMNQDKP